nr:5-oxoprolinase subunit PxpA [Halalkalibacter urbisdiaboli]
MRVDLNSDVGESYGAFQVGEDALVFDAITSANIACGYHAGDHNVMAKTVKLAKEKGVAVGAHPGYLDLQGFGRRFIQMSPEDIYHLVLYQLGALSGFCRIAGVKMKHVKPHGALYNVAAKERTVAAAIAEAVADFDRELLLFGLSGSELVKAGESVGLQVAHEVFADRTYQQDGTLTPRTEANAIISDREQALQQVLMMVKEGKVAATDGTLVPIKADTICVHGDEPQALAFVNMLKEKLQQEGIEIKAAGGRNG